MSIKRLKTNACMQIKKMNQTEKSTIL